MFGLTTFEIAQLSLVGADEGLVHRAILIFGNLLFEIDVNPDEFGPTSGGAALEEMTFPLQARFDRARAAILQQRQKGSAKAGEGGQEMLLHIFEARLERSGARQEAPVAPQQKGDCEPLCRSPLERIVVVRADRRAVHAILGFDAA